MRRGPIREHVLHLEELVWPVASDDGEPKALRALSERRLQDGALQLRRVPREGPRSPARLLRCGEQQGRKNVNKITNRRSETDER